MITYLTPSQVLEAQRGDFLERAMKTRAAYDLFEGIFQCKSQGKCGVCTVLVRPCPPTRRRVDNSSLRPLALIRAAEDSRIERPVRWRIHAR